MDVTAIPFVKKVGIVRTPEGNLGLAFDDSVGNHLQTIHAGAQYTLAETASGQVLQDLFPEIVGKVVGILRNSQIKFRKPAGAAVTAHPTVSDEAVSNFTERFSKKGRSSISVTVEIKDAENAVTCVGTFDWFVQAIEQIET